MGTEGDDLAQGARLTLVEPQASDESQNFLISLQQNVISGRYPPQMGSSSWLHDGFLLIHAWKHAYHDPMLLPG